MSSLISTKDLSVKDIHNIFSRADDIEIDHKHYRSILSNMTIGNLFFQSSLRTRVGYELSSRQLGAHVVGFSNISESRSGIGYEESPVDAVKTMAEYCDLLVIRHHITNFNSEVSQLISTPVLNAGDGFGEHPSQALIDIYTIQREVGDICNLDMGLVGDPDARAFKSLIYLLITLSVRKIVFLLPPGKSIPDWAKYMLIRREVKYEVVDDVLDLLTSCDVIEMLPIDISDLNQPEEKLVKKSSTLDNYIINMDKVISTKSSSFLLHPCPRRDELNSDTDLYKRSLVFKQVAYSNLIRKSLILSSLGK